MIYAQVQTILYQDINCWLLQIILNPYHRFSGCAIKKESQFKQHYLLPIMLENLICLFHYANNLHMSDLKSCLYKAAMIFLQKQKYIPLIFPIKNLLPLNMKMNKSKRVY